MVRLALYVCLKNSCDGVGGQDESNGTPLDPPLFWLDNIFKSKNNFGQEGCFQTSSLEQSLGTVEEGNTEPGG